MAGGLWRKSKAGPQHDELRWGRSLGIAAAVMASVIMIQHINQIERESCFDHMYREAIDIAAYIESKIATDREELELLAAVVARSPDLCTPELWQMLDSFEHIGMISDLLLLLPDDTILYDQGTRLDVSGKLSFAQRAYISAAQLNRAVSTTHELPEISRDPKFCMANLPRLF